MQHRTPPPVLLRGGRQRGEIYQRRWGRVAAERLDATHVKVSVIDSGIRHRRGAIGDAGNRRTRQYRGASAAPGWVSAISNSLGQTHGRRKMQHLQPSGRRTSTFSLPCCCRCRPSKCVGGRGEPTARVEAAVPVRVTAPAGDAAPAELPRRGPRAVAFWSRIISSISGLRFTCWPSLSTGSTSPPPASRRWSGAAGPLPTRLLMDRKIPEMDGFEATQRIRDRTSTVLDHEVPIVAMTANAFPEQGVRAIGFGYERLPPLINRRCRR